MLEQDVCEEQRRKYLEVIRKESMWLADLASSTLLMARLESQNIVGDKKQYRLDEQIRYCVVLLSELWNEKNISVEGEMPPVMYNGSQEMIRHVWLNLIGNAIKFTPENGHIYIKAKETDTDILVEIIDDGPGMNEADAKRIFEKYYQADKSKARQGLGLGLSIVQRIVELNRGSVTVISSPQKGCIFHVSLPKI